LSVIIGVAAVVAVTIATKTTRRAYHDLFTAVTGRAELEIVSETGGSFAAELAAEVQKVPGVKAAVPLVQAKYTRLHLPQRRVPLPLLGVDPARDGAVRDYNLREGRMFTDGENAMLLEADLARNLGIQLNDVIKIMTERKAVQEVRVVGLLEPQGSAAHRLAGLVYLPLATAQQWFLRSTAYINAIQIVLEESAREEQAAAAIAGLLSAGVTVRRPAARSDMMEETLLSSQQALLLITAFSLLLSAFIILNTFLMNVGERRQQLAIMRAIGATRRQVARLIFAESLVLGAIGTVLGTVLGLGGAHLLSYASNSLVQAIHPPLALTPMPFVLAAVFGLGVSMLGAVIPAQRAARLTPLEGMSLVARSDMEGTSYRFTVAGVVLSLVSGTVLAGCIAGYLPVEIAVTSAVFLMLGTVLLVPEVLELLSRLVVWLLAPLLKVEAHLAHRQVLRHRARSTLTVGVLFVASGTGIGMANAILDNVGDVRKWYQTALAGDFFDRAMMPEMQNWRSAQIPEEFDKQLRALPGIENIDTARMIDVRIGNQGAKLIVRDFSARELAYLDIRGGNRDEVRQRLFAGEVVVATVLAQRMKLAVGDFLTLPTPSGPRQFRVAALTNDYLVGGLSVYVQRDVAQRLLGIEGVDAYIIKAAPHAREQLHATLQQLCDANNVLLLSYTDIARFIEGMIIGIDAALWGLLVMCFLVAVIGVVNTLTMNVLEQTRELGLLRIVAMTRRQVRATILTQAAILGSIGLAPGVAVGVGVGYVLHLAAHTFLGRPIAFEVRPLLLVGCFVGGLTLILVSALLPAERAARLDLSKALQYE
jgi:putative ABC transport system permease protein